MAVVTLVVRDARPDGSGLLVPPGALPTIKALTHSSAKWAWVRERVSDLWDATCPWSGPASGGWGRSACCRSAIRAGPSDRDGAAGAARLVGRLLVEGAVRRWGGGLPQYQVGHTDLVGRLRSELGGRRGLAVCGAA